MAIFAGQIITADFLTNLDRQGTYTPVLTASTTNPDIGTDGEAVGRWHRTGLFISGGVDVVFDGSGIDEGSGIYAISLPFDADTSIMSATGTVGKFSTLGVGSITDASAGVGPGSRHVTAGLFNASTFRLFHMDGTNSTVQHDTPFTWGDGDRITISFAYMADPSGL